MIELATSKVCITPEKPLRLIGFAFRSKGYDCVRKDIFVRVMDFCSDGVRVVVIYGDLLWWNSRFAERMRSCLEARSGLLQEIRQLRCWRPQSRNIYLFSRSGFWRR